MSTRDWLARSFRHAIEKWLPSDAPVAKRSGPAIALSRSSKSASAAFVSSSSRTASRTFITASTVPAAVSRGFARRAASSPRSIRSCARPAASGSRTAAAAAIARPPTSADASPVPPHKPSYTLRRIWLTPEEEQGYYYGFSNRALWPLCHIAYTRPVFDAIGLGAIHARQREVRRSRARRDRGLAGHRPRAGLSLCAAAQNRQAEASRCGHQPLLAHPVAAPRSVPHLPVAGRDSRRPARQRSARLPRAAALQQFSRDRRSPRRVARRLRALLGDARVARDEGAPVSDQHRHGRHLAERARAQRRPGIPQRPRAARRMGASPSASIAWTTRRASPSACAPSIAFSSAIPVWRKRFVFLQMGAPSRTEIIEYQDLNDEVDELAAADQRQARHRRLEADLSWRARTTASKTSSPAIARPMCAWYRRCTTA